LQFYFWFGSDMITHSFTDEGLFGSHSRSLVVSKISCILRKRNFGRGELEKSII
jgi:hypothetical protein